jgi:hypothetical protein
MTTREQRAIAQAELTIGKKLGVGGSSWDVTRTPGTGAATRTPALAGTWDGYVYDDTPPRTAAPAPGGAVVDQQWAGVAREDAIPLQQGDLISDGTHRFTVVGVQTVTGYHKYSLEQR